MSWVGRNLRDDPVPSPSPWHGQKGHSQPENLSFSSSSYLFQLYKAMMTGNNSHKLKQIKKGKANKQRNDLGQLNHATICLKELFLSPKIVKFQISTVIFHLGPWWTKNGEAVKRIKDHAKHTSLSIHTCILEKKKIEETSTKENINT